MANCMALYPSSFNHHSSSECALPPFPPRPMVIAGTPLAIGMLESVDPLVRKGFSPKKVVAASGETLNAVIADLDVQYPGIGERLLENGALRRFINLYVNDEDVRFLGGLEAPVKNGDSITIDILNRKINRKETNIYLIAYNGVDKIIAVSARP